MTIRSTTKDDTRLLAVFSQQLMVENGHQNLISLEESENRIQKLMDANHRAYFFETKSSIVGYGAVDFKNTPPTIRHFYIMKQYRRMGYGRLAFLNLLQSLEVPAIDIEVYPSNEPAILFWKALGFIPLSFTMRLGGN